MAYKIEYGKFVGSKWKSTVVLPFEDFKIAKDCLIRNSNVLKDEFDFATSGGESVNIRMIDDTENQLDDKKPVRVIHYITPHYPKVSLPSTK